MSKMTKEGKQLNWLLASMVIGTFVYSMVDAITVEPARPHIQIDTPQMDVTPEVYQALGNLAAECDIVDDLSAALADDDKITRSEALAIADICVEKGTENSANPFARGQLKTQLKYVKNGGLLM